MKEKENIADNLSSDLFFLRKRLRELVVHFKPSISENDADSFVNNNMKIIIDELMKLT